MIFNMVSVGGGGRFSLLTVTTEEASFVGQNVVVTAIGTGAETESYTQVFTAASSVKFRLKQLTTYTISCGATSQTLNVAYFGEYTAEITAG